MDPAEDCVHLGSPVTRISYFVCLVNLVQMFKHLKPEVHLSVI
jgi:hypothetical protein